MSLRDKLRDISGDHFGLSKKKQFEHMIGWELWDYKLLGEIYSGSVSIVCRAMAPDDRLVAMKFLKVDQANMRYARKAFQREAQLTALWNHERLIKVLDYYPEVYQPAIILEYFDDRNMKHHVLHKNTMVREKCLKIMREATEGLGYIHDTGYIHLDVKPENILINEDAESRVIDFTLSERIGKFSLGPRKVRGSRSYIAPETILKRRPIPQTDIYSLGAAFYEMLAWRTVFVADDPNALLRKHVREQPSSIRNYVQNIHPLLDELVLQMLAKNPTDRPADCAEIVQRISKIPSPLLDAGKGVKRK